MIEKRGLTEENWDDVVSGTVNEPPKLADYFDDYLDAHVDALGPRWAAVFLLFMEAREKDPEEALYWYQALTLYPPCACVESLIGDVCRGWTGDLYAAKRHYARAVELAPHLSLFHYNLGLAYFYLGIFDKALAAFERGSAGNPEQDGEAVARCCANLGMLTGHYKGDRKAGKRHLKQSLKLLPGYTLARQMLRQL
jgi:tetratricopeptide (TPR) repeat protein